MGLGSLRAPRSGGEQQLDHGVALAPEEAARRGEDARRIPDAEFAFEIREALASAFEDTRPEPAPSLRWMQGPYLIADDPESDDLGPLRARIADRFEQIEFVEAAFSSDDVLAADLDGEELIHRFRRSFDPERSPDAVLLTRPHHVVGSTTASHGTAYRYDRHVPLVFMGPGIRPARHDRPVRTVDIGPTLAWLLGVEPPSDVDGRVLRQIVR